MPITQWKQRFAEDSYDLKAMKPKIFRVLFYWSLGLRWTWAIQKKIFVRMHNPPNYWLDAQQNLVLVHQNLVTFMLDFFVDLIETYSTLYFVALCNFQTICWWARLYLNGSMICQIILSSNLLTLVVLLFLMMEERF